MSIPKSVGQLYKLSPNWLTGFLKNLYVTYVEPHFIPTFSSIWRMQNIKLYYKNCYWTSQLRRLFREKFSISLIFVVAPCILTTLMFLLPTNALLYYTYKMLKYTVKTSHYCSYMFRPIWTIIRELMPNLARVTMFFKDTSLNVQQCW